MSYDLLDFVFEINNFVNKKTLIKDYVYRFCLVYNSLEIKHYLRKILTVKTLADWKRK